MSAEYLHSYVYHILYVSAIGVFLTAFLAVSYCPSKLSISLGDRSPLRRCHCNTFRSHPFSFTFSFSLSFSHWFLCSWRQEQKRPASPFETSFLTLFHFLPSSHSVIFPCCKQNFNLEFFFLILLPFPCCGCSAPLRSTSTTCSVLQFPFLNISPGAK